MGLGGWPNEDVGRTGSGLNRSKRTRLIMISIGTAKLRTTAVALGMCSALAVGGCGLAGIDGVELQGGVFDALGVSNSNKVKTADVKVPARPGLVIPPTDERLPNPNAPQPQATAAAPAAGGESWPLDPEANKAARDAELDRRHKEYCEREIRNAELRGDPSAVIIGPKGNCRSSIFGSVSNMITGSSDK
jgi:hypothetical protein